MNAHRPRRDIPRGLKESFDQEALANFGAKELGPDQRHKYDIQVGDRVGPAGVEVDDPACGVVEEIDGKWLKVNGQWENRFLMNAVPDAAQIEARKAETFTGQMRLWAMKNCKG